MSGVAAPTVSENLSACRCFPFNEASWEFGEARWDYVAAENILHVSADFIAAYGYVPEELSPITLDKWRQLVHPEDKHVLLMFEKVLHGETDSMDTICRMRIASGEWRFFRIRCHSVETNPANSQIIRISGTLRDITELILTDAALQRRDALLASVNMAASILLAAESEEFDQAVDQVLCILGTTTDVDRVYVWLNEMVDGELGSSQIYEWSPQVEPQQGKEYTVGVKYRVSMPNREDQLAAGECINAIVRDMPQVECDILSAQGVVSVLVAPILLRDEFWGFIGFDDCRN